MRDLTNTENKLPESLDDLKALQKEQQGEFLEKLVLLADESGSMDDFFEADNGKTKWDALKQAVELLWTKTDWQVCDTKLFLFDSMPEEKEFSFESPPNLGDLRAGGTSFQQALKAAFGQDATRIILISDGENEGGFPASHVDQAISRKIPIDTIFIEGTYSNQGAATLKRISEATGGIFTTVENAEQLMQGLAALETNERLLLEHSDAPKAIEL